MCSEKPQNLFVVLVPVHIAQNCTERTTWLVHAGRDPGVPSGTKSRLIKQYSVTAQSNVSADTQKCHRFGYRFYAKLELI